MPLCSTTTTNPTYNVSGLSVATTYSFCRGGERLLWIVRAEPGSRDYAFQRNLAGVYQITVTGTSHGTTPDAGQSVQVTLVVN